MSDTAYDPEEDDAGKSAPHQPAVADADTPDDALLHLPADPSPGLLPLPQPQSELLGIPASPPTDLMLTTPARQTGLGLLSFGYTPPLGSTVSNSAVPGLLSPPPPTGGLLDPTPQEASWIGGAGQGIQGVGQGGIAPTQHSSIAPPRPAWSGSAAPAWWGVQRPARASTVPGSGYDGQAASASNSDQPASGASDRLAQPSTAPASPEVTMQTVTPVSSDPIDQNKYYSNAEMAVRTFAPARPNSGQPDVLSWDHIPAPAKPAPTANLFGESDAARKGLLDRIVSGEGTGDDDARQRGFASGYDVALGYGAYEKPHKPLSQMTLPEVDALQTEILHNPNNHSDSSAVGRYEITQETLRRLKKSLSLPDDAVFDAALQDRLGNALLAQYGLDDYVAGKINAEQFQGRLAPI